MSARLISLLALAALARPILASEGIDPVLRVPASTERVAPALFRQALAVPAGSLGIPGIGANGALEATAASVVSAEPMPVGVEASAIPSADEPLFLAAAPLLPGVAAIPASAEEAHSEGLSGKVLDDSLSAGRDLFDGTAVPWHQKIDFSDVEERLLNAPIKRIVGTKDFLAGQGKRFNALNESYVVIFEDGMKAIWKPEKNPRLPASYAEKAAYDLAKLIGQPLVPPTVIREIDGRSGSLQYWIDSSIDLVGKGITAGDIYARMPNDSFSNIRIFQYVFGQWDIHPGNLKIDDAGEGAAIDNAMLGSRLKMRYGEQPYRLRIGFKKDARMPSGWESEGFPFDRAVVLRPATRETFFAVVSDVAEPKNIEDTWKWIRRRPQELRIVFWDRGVWVQYDPKWNGGPIRVPTFPGETMERYRRLTFENLRATLPPVFSDVKIREMLERRDQILEQAAKSKSARPL